MKRKLPWGRALFEGSVIVTSILLAFAIDAWWDVSQDRSAERGELINIADELRTNRIALDSAIARQVWIEQGIEDFLVLVQSVDDQNQVALPVPALAALLYTPSYRPATGAMQSLLSSGRLALISDRSIRNLIGGWLGAWEDANEHQELQYDHTYLRTVPWLVESDVDIDPTILFNRGAIRRGEVFADDTVMLEVRPGLKTLAGVRNANARSLTLGLRSLKAYEDSLLGLIEAFLR